MQAVTREQIEAMAPNQAAVSNADITKGWICEACSFKG